MYENNLVLCSESEEDLTVTIGGYVEIGIKNDLNTGANKVVAMERRIVDVNSV